MSLADDYWLILLVMTLTNSRKIDSSWSSNSAENPTRHNSQKSVCGCSISVAQRRLTAWTSALTIGYPRATAATPRAKESSAMAVWVGSDRIGH